MSPPQNALVRKLSKFVQLSPDEIDFLGLLQSGSQKVSAKTELVYEGQADHSMYILQAGWAYSYKLISNGGQQIISFEIPGDLIGMRSILLRTLDHSVAALTDIVISPIGMSRILEMFKLFPRLGMAFLWAASRDDAITLEHLVGIGRRSAAERIAHFFLELGNRLQLVGLASGTRYECPVNQYLLADAFGLTAVHVNRVLRKLREKRLITVRGGYVVIDDVKGLTKFSGYDSAYLDQLRPFAATAN